MARRDIALVSLVAAGLLLMFASSARQIGTSQSAIGPLAPAKPLGPPITIEQVKSAGLSLHEAMYYDKMPDGLVRCRLCPSECTLAHGQRGPCKVRANFDGTLYTLVYGRPVALIPDPIEKKPLFHVLPGTRAFSIPTIGCTLGGIFCQTGGTHSFRPKRASTDS